MKTLGMKKMKIVRMILWFSLTVVIIGISAISAAAEGPGQVPYPPSTSTQL